MHSVHAEEAGAIPPPESWSGLLTSRVWFALLNMGDAEGFRGFSDTRSKIESMATLVCSGQRG